MYIRIYISILLLLRETFLTILWKGKLTIRFFNFILLDDDLKIYTEHSWNFYFMKWQFYFWAIDISQIAENVLHIAGTNEPNSVQQTNPFFLFYCVCKIRIPFLPLITVQYLYTYKSIYLHIYVCMYISLEYVRTSCAQAHELPQNQCCDNQESGEAKCEPWNTSKPSLCCKQVIDTSTFESYQTRQLYTIVHKLNCKSKFIIYLIECALCKIRYLAKAEIAFNIRLNNHRKDVNNAKSIPADFHFRKSGHSFSLHAKFTLMEQLSNNHTTDKETLKFRLKRREDFWIQKLEMLTPKGLNQKLNNG